MTANNSQGIFTDIWIGIGITCQPPHHGNDLYDGLEFSLSCLHLCETCHLSHNGLENDWTMSGQCMDNDLAMHGK